MAIKLLLKFPVFVLFYREMNSKSGKIYLLATMKCTWCAYLSPPFIGISRHKSLQFLKKSSITLLPCLFMILYDRLAVSVIILRLGITFCREPRFYVVFSPIPVISEASHAIIDTNTNEYLPCMKIFVYVELTILQYVTFYKRKKSESVKM